MGKKEKKKVGRPSVMTPDIIDKLYYAFSIGCSDVEACAYANIAPSVLYRYQSNHDEFKERKEVLKANPILLAKEAVKKSLTSDNEKERNLMSRWVLEKKCPDEFGNRSELTISASGSLSIEERSDALDGFLKRFDID